MSVYIKPILTACYVFPILAAFFTLPYMIHQYRKYGALLMLRVLIVYTFIFYMMTSYFMTILPLPPLDSVTPDSASLLLVPFDAIRRLSQSSGFHIQDTKTYLNVLKDPNLYQILFNIALLLPFGVYLRYYFNRKWYQVLLLSFLYSLFFELTQLSGLYGIYRYPYRFFEVDDLICNTLGGMTGFWLTPLFSFFLPNREKLDQMSFRKGEHVSIFRRFLAFIIDQGILALLFALGTIIVNNIPVIRLSDNHRIPAYIMLSVICIFIIMVITKGKTIGKGIVKIRIVHENGQPTHLYSLFVREAFIYAIVLPYNLYVSGLIRMYYQFSDRIQQFLIMALISVMIVLELLFIFHLLRMISHHNSQYIYDRLLHIKTISTVLIEKGSCESKVSTVDSAMKESFTNQLDSDNSEFSDSDINESDINDSDDPESTAI